MLIDLIPRYGVHPGGVRTGEVAKLARVNPQTLRYYERRGLLPAPERTPSGYRAYSPETVRVVRFAKRAQELGFTLSEVEQLLELADGGPDSCHDAHSIATGKVADLRMRIADLQRIQDALTKLAHTCDQPRDQRECPLLAEFDDDGRP